MLLSVFHCNDTRWKKFLAEHDVFFQNALSFVLDELVLPNKIFTLGATFLSDKDMQQYNAQYRHKNKPTNVLSFPMIEDFSSLKKEPEPVELGDILLAYETIKKEAKDQGKTLRDHVAHLLVHGCLHLFGYDHMTKKDEKEMEELEIRILAEMGIENPYI